MSIQELLDYVRGQVESAAVAYDHDIDAVERVHHRAYWQAYRDIEFKLMAMVPASPVVRE